MNNYYPNPYFNPYNSPNFNGTNMYGTNYQNNPNAQPNALQKVSNKVYVSGMEGARSYNLAPNSEMILCDDTKNIIYDVVVDSNGKRTITALDVKEHQEEAPIDMSQFATKDDIAKLKEELLKRPTPTQPTSINRSI